MGNVRDSGRRPLPADGGDARRQFVSALARSLLLAVPAFLSACSGSAGGAANSNPPPPPITVSVSAPSARVATGATEQFAVTVLNASNPAVNWQVNSIPGGNSTAGTISSTGLYTAPVSPSTVTVGAVLAADNTKSGSTSVTVVVVSETNFGVFSWHGDNMLSGANTQETALTTATVSGGHFGKLRSCPVDGAVYAQPLYVSNLSLPQDGLHNVVFAATEHDSVYAFDADASPCQTLWQVSFLTGGATTVSSGDVSSTDIAPEIGITGTPVIDPSSKTLYVVAKTKESGAYVQRLHALDLATGSEKLGGPAVIQATVAGTGDGNSGAGQLPFSPLRENQQAALALAGGKVYLAFGGHGNADPFHGWIFAYNAAALNQTPAVLALTPNGSHGGIWQSGAAPSVDGSGNIFVATGNGTFDGNTAGKDYAQTVVRLNGATLLRADSFTASNQALLDTNIPPLDLGASGVLLLPDSAGSVSHPHLAMVIGQQGTLYLLDRDNLGGYKNGASGGDLVVQTFNLTSGTSATPAESIGNSTVNLYMAGADGHLQALQVANAVLSSVANSTTTFGSMGATPALSSNGSASGTGIVWALDTSGFAASLPAVLHGYDASNLATLYDSSQKTGDAAGAAVKFTVPLIANGKVYVGTQTELTVYAVLP